MGNKSELRKHYWRGLQDQWESTVSKQLLASSTYTRSGADNPMYKSLISQGSDATNDLLVTNQTIHYKPGRLSAIWIDKVYQPKRTGKMISTTIFDNWTPAGHTQSPGALFESSVANRALIGIIKKIRKHETSDFSGPTFVGELRETIAMIRSPLKSLRTKTGLFTDLHMRILRDKQAKGKRFKPDPWRKVLSDTYLEWTFGAKPLISDIGAIADVYLEKKTQGFTNGLKRLSFRFTDDTSSVENPGYVPAWAGTGISVPTQQVVHARSSWQYVVWIDQSLIFSDGAVGFLSDAARFDLSEIVPTAWELMPWSFLVDYFTNIGDVLGCTFNYNRNVAFAKLTRFNTVTRYHVPGVPVSAEPKIYVPFEFTPWEYTSQYTRVQRSKVGRLGFPQLDVNLPSVGQITNIAALFSSLAKSNPFRGFTLK